MNQNFWYSYSSGGVLKPRYALGAEPGVHLGHPRRRSINAVASNWGQISQVMAGANAIVPIIYGRVRVAPVIATYGETDSPELVICCVWGLGEIQQIHGLYTRDGLTLPTTTHEAHLGTTSPIVSALMQSAIPGWDKTLVLDLFGRQYGIAYSAIGLYPYGESAKDITGVLGDISGRKVYDPRTDTTAWSDNPALCLADFLADPMAGGFNVDWDSVEATADACDELMTGGAKRRTMNLAITRRGSLEDWIAALRTYAGCHLEFKGSYVKLIPNRPASPTRTITDSDIRLGSLSPSFRSRADTPTVVVVTYIPSGGGQDEAIAYAAGVLEGGTEWRETRIDLPGISTYAQAYREAVERLNAFQLCDLNVSFETFDEGLQDEIGDVVTLDTALLGTPVEVRILGVEAMEPGRWRVSGEEYDAVMYSDAVVSDPNLGGGIVSNPADPPDIEGLTLTEEVYQTQTGIYASRIRASWTAITWPFLSRYELAVYHGLSLVYEASSRTSEAVSGPLQEGNTYRVLVRVRSSIGAVGAWAEDSLTSQGKYLPPGDVPAVRGLEVGGEVRLNWDAATDLDIWRYEVRYGATTDDWEDAVFVDRVDGLRCLTRDIPEGTWRFFVKAIDSIGNESAEAATVDLVVSLDRNVLTDRTIFESPTLTNVVAFRLGRLDTKIQRYATDAGTAMGSLLTANPLGSGYSNPLQSYHGAASSSLETEVKDYGNIINGQFTATTSASAISGEIIETLRLSTDGGSYTDHELTVKTLARYGKIKIETDSSADTLLCAEPDMQLSLVAVVREESGTGTSSAIVGTTIECLSDYASIAQIIITPIGTTSLVGVPDNITTGDPTTFDVYIFEDGVQVACNFMWTLKGV